MDSIDPLMLAYVRALVDSQADLASLIARLIVAGV